MPLEERLIHDGFVCAHGHIITLRLSHLCRRMFLSSPTTSRCHGMRVHDGAEVVTRKGCANVDCLSKIGTSSQRFSNLANRPPENQYWFLPGRLRIMLHFATSKDDSVVVPIMGSKTRSEGSRNSLGELSPFALCLYSLNCRAHSSRRPNLDSRVLLLTPELWIWKSCTTYYRLG
jgi:hypothetical protein